METCRTRLWLHRSQANRRLGRPSGRLRSMSSDGGANRDGRSPRERSCLVAKGAHATNAITRSYCLKTRRRALEDGLVTRRAPGAREGWWHAAEHLARSSRSKDTK